MSRLVLVLGDQLSHDLSALQAADPASDLVVMAEVRAEAGYVPHHPKKIGFLFAAMRKFAAMLREAGWTVAYTEFDDTLNAGSIPGELLRRAEESGAGAVLATEPGEWRLIDALHGLPLPAQILPDDRFLASHSEFESWAAGRKQLRMEYFYREMRRKTGLLMDGDKPAGGKWNYDAENRKPPKQGLAFPAMPEFAPDAVTRDVLDLVEAQFSDNFGSLHPFSMPTDHAQARALLDHFIAHALPSFGDYQDAMVRGEPWMFHAGISACLNAGLLNPLEVARAAEAAWAAGKVPLNAAEGFIRQIIGWREYVRGIYFLEGRDYTTRNVLGHHRDLPAAYWGAPTGMACLSDAVGQTRDLAYAHHIQRLMVTGNFALLAGIDPAQVHEWYLSVYADAFEWVEAPNTIGMSQFADGGIIASKPYVSSGAYINRMSNYCRDCAYQVKEKTGPEACPFNLLYWDFLIRHRDRFANNARMGNMYRTWDRFEPEHQAQVRADAARFLERLEAGERV